MKKTALTILTSVVLFFYVSNARSQTNIMIMDLIVSKAIDQTGISADSILVDIDFKINTPASASKVHCWLGTASDSSNVLVAEPIFTTNNNLHYLTYGGITTEIKDYAADFFLKISKSVYDNFSVATLFVEATDHQMTPRIYFVK